jgi:hypothetical protein
MYPDGLMTFQGSGISSFGAGPQPRRGAVLAALAIAIAMLTLSTQLTTLSPPTNNGCTRCNCYISGYQGEAAIVALCRVGRADQAISVADSYLERLGSYPYPAARLHFLRAGALRLLGRSDEARTDYAIAARLSAADGDTLSGMDLLAQSENWSAAQASAWNVLKSAPDEPFAVNNACWELTIYPQGDAAAAARLMEPVVANTRSCEFLDTYAWALYLSGKQDAALDQEKRALQAAQWQDSPRIGYYEACVDGMQGNKQRAATELRQLFQDNITFTSAWAAANRFASGA